MASKIEEISFAPLLFAASEPRFWSKFPDGPDELWVVDIKARRNGVFCKLFKNVCFVESSGTAFIYGIEFEDGYPKAFSPELALKQQEFIRFLRDETAIGNGTLGLLAGVFSGHEYASEGKATAAYIAMRDKPLNMGIGCLNDDGEYELFSVDTSDGAWIDSAKITVPFDEFCEPDE